MKIKENSTKEISDGQSFVQKNQEVDEKLNELILILKQSGFSNEAIEKYQQKFNDEVNSNKENILSIKAFKAIGAKSNSSREDLLDEFSNLLLSSKIDSKVTSSYIKAQRFSRIFLIITGIIMIALGFAMIVMPAPPYFEMFTIYYFSLEDGVTLMDLISLAIIFSGIFIFIHSIYKKPA